MAAAWLGIVGTLIGGAIGVVGSYLTQQAHWRRERVSRWDDTRRQLFTEFLSAAEAAFFGARTLKAKSMDDPDLHIKLQGYLRGDPRMNQVRTAGHSLALVSFKQTYDAAGAMISLIYEVLSSESDYLGDADREVTNRKLLEYGEKIYSDAGEYHKRRDSLIDQMRRELGLR